MHRHFLSPIFILHMYFTFKIISIWYFIFLENSNWKLIQVLQNRKKKKKKKNLPVSNSSKRIWQEERSPSRHSEELYYAANGNCNRVILEKQKHINQKSIEIINLTYNFPKIEESTIICLTEIWYSNGGIQANVHLVCRCL